MSGPEQETKDVATIEHEGHGKDLFSLMPRNFDGAQRFCDVLAKSELVPQAYREKPANIFVAVQMGAELGLSPMQALQNIAVINGRPTLWGDAVLGLVQASGKLEYIREWAEGDVAYCEVKRRGYGHPYKTSFTQEDAKRMGLAGKQGPWSQIPQRMRQLRARAFALRDQFADVLRGVAVTEEIIDIEQTPAETPEQPKPVTQEDKGASVRERMAKQLPKEAGASSGVVPPAGSPPAAEAPVISDAEWQAQCDQWEERDGERLKEAKKLLHVDSYRRLVGSERNHFANVMEDLKKGPARK